VTGTPGQRDSLEADLGRFSEAIYKKIMSDAKQQRFQGFRPGTIPPHLEPTYRAFSMDECARETVLEAMQQNNIRPFSNAREDLVIGQVSIPPPAQKKGKQKRKGGKAKKGPPDAENPEMEEPQVDENSAPQWLSFEDMKGAIDAGWKVRLHDKCMKNAFVLALTDESPFQPGQSFSFVATNVKGQKVLSSQETEGAKPIQRSF